MEIDFPPEMKTFLDDVVDSFAMWDLLIFFSKKEGEMETSERIAKLLGRQSSEMEKPLAKLKKWAFSPGSKGWMGKRPAN